MSNLEIELKLSLIHVQLSQLRQEIQQSGTPEQKFTVLGKVQRAELLMVGANCELSGGPPVLWLDTEEKVFTQ